MTDTSALPAGCAFCGRADLDMDAWLGICHACLARAGGTALEEENRQRQPALPHVAGFLVRRLIGSGGMGAVYEAVRELDGTKVALKLIAPEMAAEARFREQFQREAEALRRLDHPGVVRRLDVGEEQGLPWLAMEFIDGPDLRQVLRRGPVPVARALEIAAAVGEALSAAHAAGIVHRDIKPANVLLDVEGRVKVADFGMARSHGPEGGVTDPLTLVAAAAGHYSAPELEFKGAGDARADIYSLGALLYHLLTGHAPRAHFQPARRVCPAAGISAGVDRIISRCLQTDPARRFPDMQDLVSALQVEIRRLTRPHRPWWPWAWAAAALLVAVIGCLFRPVGSGPEGAPKSLERQIASRLSAPPLGWAPRRMTNTLGMPFVGVPGCDALFCIWETRCQDYAAFAEPWPDSDTDWVRESGFAFPIKKPVFSLRQGEFKAAGKTWRSPGFTSGPDHAVCGVSASDAMAFCTWLTWKERREGKIRADQAYRLPTDEEWSAAAGLKPEPGSTPEEHEKSWPPGAFVHAWGFTWPAPDDLYNVVSDEVNGWEDWHPGWQHRPRRDGWRGTAPVNAVPADPRGLHHLTGNVSEWTETPYNQQGEKHALVIRGASWQDASREGLSLVFRNRDLGSMRITTRGFRIVFQESAAPGWRYGEKK